MTISLAMTTFIVRDYDEAIAWFTEALGFKLMEDTVQSPAKRWVVVGSGDCTKLLLAKASNETQTDHIGKAAGGRVGFFLHTDDFLKEHARMTAAGVKFKENPRHEVYGTVAVFEDLYGNLWDLIEPR